MNLQVIRGNQSSINVLFLSSNEYLLKINTHVRGQQQSLCWSTEVNFTCMPKFLKTWKAKVVGTFCFHIGTVFQAGAASYFACRSAPYENQRLCISL